MPAPSQVTRDKVAAAIELLGLDPTVVKTLTIGRNTIHAVLWQRGADGSLHTDLRTGAPVSSPHRLRILPAPPPPPPPAPSPARKSAPATPAAAPAAASAATKSQ